MGNPIEPMQLIVPIQFSSYAYERASTATYYGSDGLLNTAIADQLRLGYDPSSLAYIGAIIEGEAENLLLHSNAFDEAPEWYINGTYNIVNPQITPDGSMTAQYIEFAAPYDPLSQSPNPVTTGELCTFSIYLKWRSGSKFLTLTGNDGEHSFDFNGSVSASGTGWIYQKLPNGWFRCSITGDSDGFPVGVYISPGGGAGSFYFANAQMELGSIATSYIETGATTETRAADVAGDPPVMLSTNIPETDYPEWDVAESYSKDEFVMVASEHRNYQSLIAGTDTNTGNTPSANPDKWLDAGATNAWRMFDMQVGADLQSFHEETIEASLALGEIVTAVCLFNIQGVSATVRMTLASSEVVYEKTIELPGLIASPSWYDFYFGKRQQIKSALFLDLPPYPESTITIIVDNGDDVAMLGKAVIGRASNLGFTEYQSSAGIVSYSVKQVDTFGNSKIVPRRFVGTMDLKVVIDLGGEDYVMDQLTDARDICSVFIGHKDYSSLVILGFYNDFRILFSTAASSYCNMTVTGI